MNEGARYYNCDFQIHTPRDLQFSGKEYVSDEERKQYAEEFIKACRKKNLNAVAITDHHDIAFFNYIKDASIKEKNEDGSEIEEYNRIVVFPGIELTLDVPCQALLLFDSELEMKDENITKIYTALSIQSQNPRNQSKGLSPERLPIKSINDIYERLNAVDILQNRFIVFPNVKDNGGDSILRDGFHNEYANGKFVGGYLDKGQYTKHKMKVGWNNVINGKVEAYGYRSIGIFQTSDCRNDKFEDLGNYTTWVKWCMPTTEGLRQACLAKTSRILQEEPVLPATYLSSIKILNSDFLNNLEFELNPQFNVLIGGRGTGKSSILQYISWALGKDIDDNKEVDLQKFIENTLSNGSVELIINKNGIPHVIKRSLQNFEIKIGNEQWQSTNSENIVSIIRTDSFAQKELSKHEKNRTSQLIKIIENSINDELDSINRKIEENANKIKEVSTSYETYLSNIKTSNDLKIQIDSIEEQIKSLSEKLDAIEPSDQLTIKNNTSIDLEKEILKKSSLQINALTTSITNILSNGNFSALVYEENTILNKSEINELANAHDQIIEAIKSKLSDIVNKSISESLNSARQKISELHERHDKEYLEAKTRQNSFEQIIKSIEELRKKLNLITQDRNALLIQINEQKSVKKNLQRLFFERLQLSKSSYQFLQKAAIEVQHNSEGSIEIELSKLENIDFIVDDFIEHVTGSKGQPDRTRAFFNDFIRGDKTEKQLLKFWYSIYQAINTELTLEEIIDKYGIENPSLLETDFERILDSFNANDVIEFSLKLPTYNLKLSYCKDSVTKIAFEDASYGQQAGSILTILLNQEFGPLLIDQPEDDLDNKVVHRITENIVTAKHKRQLIFSSHNANIAVNGDAELIVVFDHNADKSAGEIVCMGAIDKDEIKEQVKEIMEGGKVAFELRKTKYGF